MYSLIPCICGNREVHVVRHGDMFDATCNKCRKSNEVYTTTKDMATRVWNREMCEKYIDLYAEYRNYIQKAAEYSIQPTIEQDWKVVNNACAAYRIKKRILDALSGDWDGIEEELLAELNERR